jgi:hypothetical protein
MGDRSRLTVSFWLKAAVSKASPRSTTSPYLGGINDYGIKRQSDRCAFWDEVTAAFDRLGNRVSAEDRKRFEAAIKVKVPRPSAKQRAAYPREQAQRVVEEVRALIKEAKGLGKT